MAGYVTPEQIARAREVRVLDYVMRYEADRYKRVGSGYRMKEHPSFAVNEKGFYWHSHNDIKGRTALDYLVSVHGYGLVDAVCLLLGEKPHEKGDMVQRAEKMQYGNKQDARNGDVLYGEKLYKHSKKSSYQANAVNITSNTGHSSLAEYPPLNIITPKTNPPSQPITPTAYSPPEQPPLPHSEQTAPAQIAPIQTIQTSPSLSDRIPFSPPRRHKDNRRVIAYLQSRGIDRDLIMACINQGSLYEGAYWHNCVFTGKDEHGKTRFAALRSTTTGFMRDADGSDKKYGFVLPPVNSSEKPDNTCTIKTVAVYESPVDCLSHQTLCKQGHIPLFDGWRLSLGCISTVALEHFLTQHPEITHCIICTDNDEAGEKAAEKITTEVAEKYSITTERVLPPYGGDWNDTLQKVKKAERTQIKTQHTQITAQQKIDLAL